LGKAELGLPYLQVAWEADPSVDQYWLTLAECLLAMGHPKDALLVIKEAIKRGIKSPQARQLLMRAKGNKNARPSSAVVQEVLALFNSARYAELEERAKTLVGQYPNWAFGWKALGTAMQKQGKDGVKAMQRAVELAPNDAEAHNNLGMLFVAKDLTDSAAASFRKALKIKPEYAEAHVSLGAILRNQGQIDAAMASFRHALELKPDYALAHSNLGNTLNLLGRTAEAEASHRRALQIRPDFAELHSNMLFFLSHGAAMDASRLFAEHCRFGEQFEASHRAGWPQYTNSRDPERCLQVGFVSADLYHHAVANFIEPVLAHLAGYPQLSLHAYSNNVIEDGVTRRLRGYLKHWHPVAHLSDAALAEKIRADGIDILIDLSGHTTKNRLPAFARKPAPVQASWIGYPGTTGLNAMDYYLSDRFLLPQGEFDDQFTEKIVRLPASVPFLPYEGAPPVNALPALSNGHVTFGSFNRTGKLSHAVIVLWAQLLRALPDSRMLLGGMPEEGKYYDTLIEWFAREGIARERLSFHPRSGMDAYLALHHQVDICLDTLPYSGGTTTLHALWMGVPTLTLAGGTIPGRTSAGILGHVGLEAFIAYDAADFVQKGLALTGNSATGNLAALSDIRAGLRERFAKSAMGQPAVVATGVERALRIMWQRWCAGLPAESFEVGMQDMGNVMQEACK